MKTKLQEIIQSNPKKVLTQEEKFILRYGNNYMERLGCEGAYGLSKLKELYCQGTHWEEDEK